MVLPWIDTFKQGYFQEQDKSSARRSVCEPGQFTDFVSVIKSEQDHPHLSAHLFSSSFLLDAKQFDNFV